MILALDLGTRTGYAYDDLIGFESGWVDFKTKRMESPGMRYVRFKQWLESHTPAPKVIVFEEVRRHAGTTAAHVYGGFLAHLTAFCAEEGVEYVGVPVGTIKKFATGKGNASKEMMIFAAQTAGRDITDDNEADAYWILMYAKKELGL